MIPKWIRKKPDQEVTWKDRAVIWGFVLALGIVKGAVKQSKETAPCD